MPEKNIFQRLVEGAAAEGLDFLLIGGHAVNAHGYLRTTLDVDFLAPEPQRAAWNALLVGWGYHLFHERKSFSQYELPTREDFDVDAMFVDEATFAKLKTSGTRLPVGSTLMPVAGVLHLIALKLHATRTWERAVEGKDFYDIVNLIRINHIDPDSNNFREILDRYATDSIRQRLLSELRRKTD